MLSNRQLENIFEQAGTNGLLGLNVGFCIGVLGYIKGSRHYHHQMPLLERMLLTLAVAFACSAVCAAIGAGVGALNAAFEKEEGELNNAKATSPSLLRGVSLFKYVSKSGLLKGKWIEHLAEKVRIGF